MPSTIVRHPPGAISRLGAAGKAIASFCSRPPRRSPISTIAIEPDDVLLFGRESAGVPHEVHEAADARLVIPMRAGLRSLNVAVAAAMAAGEALRQTGGMKQTSVSPRTHGDPPIP